MTLSNQLLEIQRLIKAFESEAAKFHDLRLCIYFVTQSGSNPNRKFISPNHAIMLWQYYGPIEGETDVDRAATNLQESDIKWGLRGAELSCFALIEGEACSIFARMAKRAGTLFDKTEAGTIKSRVVNEIRQNKIDEYPTAKLVTVTNDDPLAIWLNFLLYHLSMTNSGRENFHTIEPDPFTISLLALERLAEDQIIGKIDRSIRRVAEIHFKVAMSFPGEKRAYVEEVVTALRCTFEPDTIFYDYDYQAQLARPNLDILLQDIYRNRSELIVVFLCAEYAQKQWCGLEWRAIRDIIKDKDNDRVMFVRFDDAPVEGVLSIDGYIDARSFGAQEVAQFIAERLGQR